MNFYQNQWGEYINLNNVVKIWISGSDEAKTSSIFARFIDGHEEDMACFKDDKQADEYLYELMNSYSGIDIVSHEEIRYAEEDDSYSENFVREYDEKSEQE